MDFKGTKDWSLRVKNKILTNEYGVKYLSLDDNVSVDCIQVYADSRLKKKQQLIELKANAKLIAAAPDLLEALIECLDGVEELNNEYQDGWDSTIQKAKQAIEKALK